MLVKRILRIAVIALVAWVILTCIMGCKPKVSVENPKPNWDSCSNQLGQHPCDFKMIDQNGKNVNLYDHLGKVIVLDFSAMWCGPCRMAATEVDEIVKKYGKNDVVYITLLVENSSGNPPTEQNLKDWADAFGIEINPVLGASREWLSTSGYQLEAWPTFYFINSQMIVKEYQRGYSRSNIESAIQNLLFNLDTGE